MPWIIESYVGVNELRFGMRPEQVAGLAGSPKKAREGTQGRMVEFRALEDPNIHYENRTLSELIFSRYTRDLEFRGMRVFEEDQGVVLSKLLSLAPDMVDVDGVILSLSLGVSMTGFQDPDESDKSFGAFRRGVWDNNLDGAKPLRLQP